MSLLSGLGILLSLVFACLLLALVAELYYLLWWKKQRICRNSNRVGADYTNHTNKELFYLFCWDKPSSIINPPDSNTIVANPEANYHNDPDVEMGLASNKDMLLKALGEDGVESEIMRLHNLVGPPRFLFTINEESKEDLESDDGRSKGDRSRKGSRTRSLGDLVALENQNQSPFFSPLASPPLKVSSILLGSNNNNYDNPLFESSVEAELNRLRNSPPPTFKFLRDAEEKLYRRLLEEAQKTRSLTEVVNGGKNKEMWEVHCSSLQVLPLASSPPNADENKPSLHH